jgi:NAD-dependent dihydropyrimidine dehydrogenase PreA subunit
MSVRDIARIDSELCDGCGACVPSCAEGAIRIVDGKAVLAADNLCDGLGACLGDCPRGAITIVRRDAAAFDERAVEKHLDEPGSPAPRTSCQGPGAAPAGDGTSGSPPLPNWPVRLPLVNPAAPWLAGADLLVAADCVPFALPSFHADLVAGRVVVSGCPKADDPALLVERLAEIIHLARPHSVTVARMEVPCCGALTAAVRRAIAAAAPGTPLREVIVGRDASLRESTVDR